MLAQVEDLPLIGDNALDVKGEGYQLLLFEPVSTIQLGEHMREMGAADPGVGLLGETPTTDATFVAWVFWRIWSAK